ncbi:MAG: putative glycosyl transferase [Chloroflexi bacterium ADurb.Bin222]|nr:MAG: putative glycosyl transferase [Chloroflexi bacterium ADurb.Bin222]
MQVPCVLTDISGCREVVIPGYSGLLVPPGDVKALAEALVTLLSNQDLARRMGEAGRVQAIAHFDERAVFARVKAEYARLLQEQGLTVPAPLRPEVTPAGVAYDC